MSELKEAEIQSALSDFYTHFHKTKMDVQPDLKRIVYNVNPFNDFAFNEAKQLIKAKQLPLTARLSGTGIFKTNKLIIEAI